MQTSNTRTRVWCAKTPSNITKCASLLSEGKLVAFPTETVYGLGAKALDKNAILNIFLTKKRPLTDPLIVHIYELEMAKQFQNLSPIEYEVFQLLAKNFWPGPLTIVGKAQASIPKELCANTGFVGVRFPQHKLTLDLLSQAKVAVAAPSANLFGHVSPTKAEHVFKDFKESDIDILNGGSTPFGIESTVIKLTSEKVNEQNNKIIIEILRHGSVSFAMLEKFVNEFNDKASSTESSSSSSIRLVKKRKIVSEETDTDSPGQFLKHYSPNKDSFILKNVSNEFETSLKNNSQVDLKKSILIDFGASFVSLKSHVGIYLDLSEEGDIREAMKNYYCFLRDVEEEKGLDQIFIVDLHENKTRIKKNEDFVDSLQDKIFRSCEGHFAIFKENEGEQKVYLV
jgi:tRNA threonylcarbamoyl adenosine modification protein (Sua5/YciO/YrdC/YwlC family)